MRIRSPGFSLIELMIVVTIVSILAAISIPSYQHYTKRARFTEVIAATMPFKIAIALALQTGISPQEIDSSSRGMPAEPDPTKNLANITVKNGIITATATELATGATYILKPDSDGTHWTVTGTCLRHGLCHA